jgi:hypothetical protein
MLDINPDMPYRLAGTPYVNKWFSTADAPDASSFVQLLSEQRLDALEKAGGVCILSTHLGKGFVKDGNMDPQVERILNQLGRRPGWYVPVTEMLDHLAKNQRQTQCLGWSKALILEMRFIMDKIFSA